MPAFAKRNAIQFRIRLFKVGNWGHDSCVQTTYRDYIFQASTHGVAGKTFGVADNDIAYVFAKGSF